MSEFPPPQALEPPRPGQPFGPPTWSRTGTGQSAPSPITEQQRRWWTGVPTAVWIGLVGSMLILAAAMFVVVARWDSIGRGLRSIGVATVTMGFVVAAYRLRRITPTMASMIIHLGGALTAMVAIAVVSMFGFTWPACIAVGGLVGFGVCWWLSRDWQPSRFAYIEVVNLAVASVGIAALTHTTAGLWIAVAGAGCLLVGWRRRAVALSVLAVATPISAIAAAAGVGPGTLARAGMVGDRLLWSGPLVGLIAGVVVILAGRSLGRGVVVGGASLPLIGLVTGLAASDAPAAVWWSLPGFILIAINIALATSRSRGEIDRSIETVVDVFAALVAAGGAVIALGASPSINTIAVLGVDIGAGRWVVPAVATLFGVATTVYRWHRSTVIAGATRANLIDGGLVAIVSLAYGSLVVLNVPMLVVAVATLAAGAAAASVTPTRGPVFAGPTFLIVTWACARVVLFPVDLAADPMQRWVAVVITAGALVGAIVLRARPAADSGVWGIVETTAIALIGAIAIALFSGWTVLPSMIALTAVATSLTTLLDHRYLRGQLIAVAAVAVVGAETYTILAFRSWPWAVGFGVAAAALAVVAIATDDEPTWFIRPSMVSAVLGALSTVTVLRALQLSPSAILIATCALAVAGIGMWVVYRFDALAAYAATVTIFLYLLTPSLGGQAWWASVLVILIGSQVTIIGARLSVKPVTAIGMALFVLGALSLLWTTPLNEWIDRWLAAIDATAADLAVFGITVAALAVGWWLRRRFDVSSWWAYSVGLSIGGLWLTIAAAARVTPWAIPLGLILGVGAAVVGAWGRLGAPLVGGTAITLGTVIAGYRNYVGAVPVWVWLGVGGVVLVGVAVAVERGTKQGARLGDLITRWQ